MSPTQQHARKAPTKKKAHASFGRKRSLVVVLAAVVLFMVSAAIMTPYVPDDSYISFRYAEHLANGNGLTFNIGEPPVEGYSNLLWILMLALLHRFGFELATVAPLVSACLGALALLLLAVLFQRRRVPPQQMVLPLLLFASSGPFVMYAVSGMETALFSLLLLASLYFVDRIISVSRMASYVGLSVCSVLLMLTRPEGVVVFPVAAVFLLWMARTRVNAKGQALEVWKPLTVATLIFAVPVAIYNAWRVSYFGEFLPTPFLSKAAGGASIVEGWSRNIGMYLVEQGYEYPPSGYYFLVLIMLAVVGSYLLGPIKARKPTERLALLLAMVYVLIYLNFRDWMPGMRYHAPLVGLLLLPIVHVQDAFFRSKTTLATKPARLKFAGVVTVCLLISFSNLVDLKRVGIQIEEGNRECLIPLGKWLAEVMPDNSLLAMSDVGAAPYHSRLRTLDINKESLTDIHIAKGGFSNDYIINRRPGVFVFVSRGIYAAKMDPLHFELASSPEFGELYRFVGAIRYQWYEDRSYWIYVPKSMPPIPQELVAALPGGVGQMRRIEYP